MVSGGRVSLQIGIAYGHLGWNRHPGGGVIRFGPARDRVSSLSGWSYLGIDPRRPWVYGWRGRRNSSVTGPTRRCAGVHHIDVVADLGHDPEVVGDEHDGGSDPFAQVAHQLEDLGLDRDVQGGRGLVRKEHLRLARERHCDHHSLEHPAGELVRVAPGDLHRVGDARPRAPDDPPERLLAERLPDPPLDAPKAEVGAAEAGNRSLRNWIDVALECSDSASSRRSRAQLASGFRRPGPSGAVVAR